MEENKIYIDRKMPSKEAIERHKDFETLLERYEAGNLVAKTDKQEIHKPASPQRWYYYLGGVAACLLIGLFVVFQDTFNNDAAPQTSETAVSPPIIADSSLDRQSVAQEKPTPIVKEQKTDNLVVVEDTKTKKEKATKKEAEKVTPQIVATPPTPPIVDSPPPLSEPQKPKGKTIQLKLENEALYPELKAYKNHQWEYAGNTDELDPWKNNIFGRKNHWDNASVTKEGQNLYTITLSKKDGTAFSFPARIVFSGEAYEEALKTYHELKGKE